MILASHFDTLGKTQKGKCSLIHDDGLYLGANLFYCTDKWAVWNWEDGELHTLGLIPRLKLMDATFLKAVWFISDLQNYNCYQASLGLAQYQLRELEMFGLKLAPFNK